MRSTAICAPTSAVLPIMAAPPDSGWSVPIRYGFGGPKAVCHGAGTKIVAPRPMPPVMTRRRVVPGLTAMLLRSRIDEPPAVRFSVVRFFTPPDLREFAGRREHRL